MLVKLKYDIEFTNVIALGDFETENNGTRFYNSSMRAWCYINCIGLWDEYAYYNGDYYYVMKFEKQADAAAFKMIWK